MATEVLSFLLDLAISDKKISPVLTSKNWLRHLAVRFLKQSNNLNNIGRGCPTNHLCLILLKSDQKFLTRF